MSEIQTEIEALTERVQKLEQYVDSQVTTRFDDVQDGHRALAERMNEYQGRVEERIGDLTEKVAAELRESHSAAVEQFKKEAAKVATRVFQRSDEEGARNAHRKPS